TARDWQTALVQMVTVLVHGLGVLAVGRAYPAYRRNAKPDQVTVGLGAVALEIAVQPALALGHGQRVIRKGEVVHADADVTRLLESRQRLRQHGLLGRGSRQFGRMKTPLRLETLGQV